jgi:hypothetical protein
LNKQVVADEEAVTDVPDSDEEEPVVEPTPAPVKKVKKVVKRKTSAD